MRILAVSTSCWTAANREFYRRLGSSGYQVTIAIPSEWDFGSGALPAEPRKDEDPEIEFLQPTNFHQRLYRLNGLSSLIERLEPNAIYFEGDPGSLMCVYLGRITLRNGIKLFALSCENLSQSPIAVIKREGINQFVNSLIKYALIQFSKKYIDTLFVINLKGLEYFKKLGFKNVIKTPLGFNESIFRIDKEKRFQIRENLGIAQDKIVIAYFGRLVYEKGVHLLIEALENLDSSNCYLLIDKFSRYSSAYQKEVYESILNSKIKTNTLFFEAQHLEIADYMNASDITILPSIATKKWVEQYGRVVPEAIACGNLLIVSDEGAPKDFFEKDYPFIFKSGNVNDLQDKIENAKMSIRNFNYNREKNAIRTINKFGLMAQVEIFKKNLIVQ